MALEEFIKHLNGEVEEDWDHDEDAGWPKGQLAGDWGSCQYWGAMRCFDGLESLHAAGKDPLKELGLEVQILRTDDVVEVFDLEQLEEMEKTDADDLHGQEYRDYLEEKKVDWFCEKNEAEKQECINDEQVRADEKKKFLADMKVNPNRTVTEAFEIYRDCSWDLWGAAGKLGSTFFELPEETEDLKAPGKGPIFNILAQEENYETGLYCWLLWHYIIKRKGSPEEIFGGFDT